MTAVPPLLEVVDGEIGPLLLFCAIRWMEGGLAVACPHASVSPFIIVP